MSPERSLVLLGGPENDQGLLKGLKSDEGVGGGDEYRASVDRMLQARRADAATVRHGNRVGRATVSAGCGQTARGWRDASRAVRRALSATTPLQPPKLSQAA